jgi:2-amino-4-hydroxy-6-hydroxymethyldihydropteridine diphosphokinase
LGDRRSTAVRQRGYRGCNGARATCFARPRTLDLDLLAYDDRIINDAVLTLPHPHLFERAFVLVPLAEIAPERVIGGKKVHDALARVDASGIEKLLPA